MNEVINLDQWGGIKQHHQNVVSGIFVDGLHEVKCGKNTYYLMVKNSPLIEKYDKLIFSFNGAVSNRESKTAPFFTMLGVAERLNLPIISISDHSTMLYKTLGLSWYLGNETFEDFSKVVANCISSICNYYNVKPVLIGGSGGGFAALNISHKLDCESDVLVWNPQTDISKYYRRHVMHYFGSAFSNIYTDNYQEMVGRVKQRLLSLDVFQKCKSSNVLYLQNNTDQHYELHAKPFIEFNNLLEIDKNYWGDGNIYLLSPKWGEGHVEPPIYAVEYIINEIMKDNSLKNICSNLMSIDDFVF